MKIVLGCDHAGFALKPVVLEAIRKAGHTALDVSGASPVPGDDYPDVVEKVAKELVEKRAERGVLICGSGVGACIAANKFPGVYAAVCHDTYSAHQGVEHDDMNVLCLGSRIVGPELARELVAAFLAAKFSKEERHRRRVAKVRGFETGSMGKAVR